MTRISHYKLGRVVAVIHQPFRHWRICPLVAFCVLAGGYHAQAGEPLAAALTQHPAKPFAPGIRLNWSDQMVEIDAVVVLRNGPLELLACSPKTREHESILVVQAKPHQIHQALGLIGLQPGSPVCYDQKKETWHPPSGDPLRIRIRVDSQGERTVTLAGNWLRGVESHRIPKGVDFVFSGSRTYEDGRFGANLDGTVICLVDFDTALMTIGSLRSADNQLLWVEANPDLIPPLGTKCVLLIDRAYRQIEIEVNTQGKLRYANQAINAKILAVLMNEQAADDRQVRFILLPSGPVSASTLILVKKQLVGMGAKASQIFVKTPQ